MPVIRKITTVDGATVIIWKLTESEDRLRILSGEPESGPVSSFKNIRRRIESYGWRAALRTVLPDAVVFYDKDGCPCVADSGKYIGVTHCKGFAAIIVADNPCAIDAEDTGRNFTRAARKFVSDGDAVRTDNTSPEGLPLVWCAKETVYKYFRSESMDFLGGITVDSIDRARKIIRATAFPGTPHSYTVIMEYIIIDSLIVVYTV